MKNIQNNIYELTVEQELKFFFISKGNQDIVKVIQYSFIEQLNDFYIPELNGKNIYNLGFGDYDINDDTVIDTVNTNNGDPYKVFNTVLSTIPIFFEHNINDILIVQGSDGRPEFIELCKKTCTKTCNTDCKKFNKRLKIYINYINQNYNLISTEYQILGGQKDNQNLIVPYVQGKEYDAVLLFRKN